MPIARCGPCSMLPSATVSSPILKTFAAEFATSWPVFNATQPHHARMSQSEKVEVQPGGFMSRKTMLSLVAIAFLAVSAFGQTADEILEKNLKAMGGKDKIKALQSMRI